MRRFFLLLIFLPALLSAQPEHLFERADSLVGEGQLRDAIRQLEEVVRDYPEREHDCSDAYLAISGHYLTLGDFGAALAANARSREIREKMRSDDLADNFARFGEISLAMGRYEAALAYLERARDLPFLFPELFARVNALTGEAFRESGRPQTALTYYDKAITLLEIEFGPDDPLLESFLTDAGRTALAAGQPGRAAAYFRRALGLSEDPVFLYQLLGEAALAAGDGVEARDQLLRALRWYEASPDARRGRKARAELTMARLASLEKQPEEEQLYIGRAIRTLCPRFEPAGFADNPRPTELILDRMLLAGALERKIRHLLRRGDPASLEAAAAAALSGAEQLDLFLPYSDPEQWRWRPAAGQAAAFFAAAVEAVRLNYETTGDESYLRRACELAERGRQWEWRLYQLILLQESPYQDALAQEWPVRRWLGAAEAALGREPQNDEASVQVKQRQGILDQLIERKQQEQPRLYRWIYARDFARFREVAEEVGEQTLLAAYYVGPEQSFIAVTGREGTELLTVPVGADSLARLVADLRRSLDTQDEVSLVRRAAHLHQILIGPFAGRLKKKEQLVIVPHGPLHHLPFGLLPGREVGGRIRHHKLDYLGVEFVLSTSPSLTQWRGRQETAPGDLPLAFAGFAPEFTGGDGLAPAAYVFLFDTLYQSSRGLRAAVPDGKVIAPLAPAAAGTMAAAFGSENTRLLVGAAATEQALRETVGSARHLFLRTHAFANTATPVRSGLLLTPAGGTPEQDGFLWSPDVFGLDAPGNDLAMDGFLPEAASAGLPGSWCALATPWLRAGARSCLGTVAGTAGPGVDFWEVYYEKAASGLSPDRALQATAAALVRSQEKGAPWFWGQLALVW